MAHRSSGASAAAASCASTTSASVTGSGVGSGVASAGAIPTPGTLVPLRVASIWRTLESWALMLSRRWAAAA